MKYDLQLVDFIGGRTFLDARGEARGVGVGGGGVLGGTHPGGYIFLSCTGLLVHTRSVLTTVLPLVDVGSGGIGGGRTFFDARGLGGVSHGNFGTGGFWFLNKLLGNSPAKIFNSFFTLFFFQVDCQVSGVFDSSDISAQFDFS